MSQKSSLRNLALLLAAPWAAAVALSFIFGVPGMAFVPALVIAMIGYEYVRQVRRG